MRLGATVLRVAVAAVLFIHGAWRATHGVPDFGAWLASRGLPFGLGIAWLVTGMELVATLALAAGRFVPWLCGWFALVLGTGIVMVHAPEGWFVVGYGRNGMEFSVLLLVCLGVIALQHARRPAATP